MINANFLKTRGIEKNMRFVMRSIFFSGMAFSARLFSNNNTFQVFSQFYASCVCMCMCVGKLFTRSSSFSLPDCFPEKIAWVQENARLFTINLMGHPLVAQVFAAHDMGNAAAFSIFSQGKLPWRMRQRFNPKRAFTLRNRISRNRGLINDIGSSLWSTLNSHISAIQPISLYKWTKYYI